MLSMSDIAIEPRSSTDLPRTKAQEVRSAWVNELKEREADDVAALYYPFIINNLSAASFRPTIHAPAPDELGVVRRLMTKCCEFATCVRNKTKNANNVQRLSTHDSVGCIVLPAKVPDSPRLHLHGWLRVPAIDKVDTQITIRQNNRDQKLKAPLAIAAFIEGVDTAFGDYTTEMPIRPSIWFAHNGNHVLTDAQQERPHGAKEYAWKDWKGEVRRWDDLEFVPNYLFRRLNEKRCRHVA